MQTLIISNWLSWCNYFNPLSNLELKEANGVLDKLISQGKELLISEGFNSLQQEIIIQLDMKYIGQTSELTITMPDQSFTIESINKIQEISQSKIIYMVRKT